MWSNKGDSPFCLVYFVICTRCTMGTKSDGKAVGDTKIMLSKFTKNYEDKSKELLE